MPDANGNLTQFEIDRLNNIINGNLSGGDEYDFLATLTNEGEAESFFVCYKAFK